MHFKKGRDKSASFGFFDGDEGEKVAARFGISELPAHGKVIYCAVDGKDGERHPAPCKQPSTDTTIQPPSAPHINFHPVIILWQVVNSLCLTAH